MPVCVENNRFFEFLIAKQCLVIFEYKNHVVYILSERKVFVIKMKLDLLPNVLFDAFPEDDVSIGFEKKKLTVNRLFHILFSQHFLPTKKKTHKFRPSKSVYLHNQNFRLKTTRNTKEKWDFTAQRQRAM